LSFPPANGPMRFFPLSSNRFPRFFEGLFRPRRYPREFPFAPSDLLVMDADRLFSWSYFFADPTSFLFNPVFVAFRALLLRLRDKGCWASTRMRGFGKLVQVPALAIFLWSVLVFPVVKAGVLFGKRPRAWRHFSTLLRGRTCAPVFTKTFPSLSASSRDQFFYSAWCFDVHARTFALPAHFFGPREETLRRSCISFDQLHSCSPPYIFCFSICIQLAAFFSFMFPYSFFMRFVSPLFFFSFTTRTPSALFSLIYSAFHSSLRIFCHLFSSTRCAIGHTLPLFFWCQESPYFAF